MTNYEHLPLPKVEIELPRRPRRGGGGSNKRSDRSSHGSLLLTQVSSLSKDIEEKEHLGINPKLIFKIKVRENDSLENHLPSLGLNLLAKEPKEKQAIVVFADDNRLTEFQKKLESYAGTDGSPGYLDDIKELVPLEPEDRIGALLKRDPLEPGSVIPLDMELWHTGNKKELQSYIDEVDNFLRDIQLGLGMRVSDRYIGEYICNVRILVNSDILELLLQEYQVKEIDRRPKPAFESPAEYNIPVSDLPEISSPPEEATGILVIDSGVQRGHPLIGPALGDADVFPDRQHQFVTGGPDDGDTWTGGHGTGVSGIAIYGDLAEGIKNRLFQPQVWLFSARVTNQNNEYQEESLLENQLEDAIDYFVSNYSNCKVINISLGNSDLIYQEGEKQFRLAATIDEIAYRLQDKNLVFVLSAGNFWYDSDSRELIHKDYPDYLLKEEARIIDPATAAIALTVGSLSMGKGSYKYPNDARIAIAKVEKYPSPFTRSGFGVDGMIKPDLVEFGGGFILDRDRIDHNDWGPAIITLNKNFQGSSLFKAYVGTSFSAPRVANLAAKLFTKFPNASSNLIRSLIADSAQIPTNIPSSLDQDLSKQKIYGYGQPNFEKAAYSTENQVLLLEDHQSLPVGRYCIYEVPALPREFVETKGTKTLSVTLAFDPPTRHTRGDSYLGITMEFHLFKNVAKEKLTQAFTDAKKIDDSDFTEIPIGDLTKIKLLPNLTTRKKGTLQKGQHQFTSLNWKYDYKPLYLVVACNKKWVDPEKNPSQRYALVVSIAHSDPKVDLYNQIKLKIQGQASERIRF
ncbi:S8 family peptidase [Roseofilum sp. BLCC_M91]|uniref:S8 family peptidase n=1 Tax=Roseofilum halophilum BLCC-M91 TaxID=3022259 RepID=A0ABT7BIQ7_9CYAN|nr:S8 family peptidase [Roseofilum halophilum]MDJ1179070.1 S8 family peptidase [Roseofilum halophilum BLCC-M91]